MNRNEITLQEMFSSVIKELREGGRWGTAHIYQSAVNAFSAFTKWQPMPMRKLSPTVLKRFENFLRQRNCSWNTVSTYIKTCDYQKSPYCIIKALYNAAKGNMKRGYAFAGSNAFLSEKIRSVKEVITTLNNEFLLATCQLAPAKMKT